MSTEINQAMDSKKQENIISCILHDKFFSIDAGQSELKSALSEHLNRVKTLFSDSPDKFKIFSLLAVGGIYAVEKDMEGAAKHREMLLDIWRNECRAACGNDAVEELERTAHLKRLTEFVVRPYHFVRTGHKVLVFPCNRQCR